MVGTLRKQNGIIEGKKAVIDNPDVLMHRLTGINHRIGRIQRDNGISGSP